MGSEFDKVSALLRVARRRITGIPVAFDLDARLALALSDSDRLAKQPLIPTERVQIILSSDRAQEPPASDEIDKPES